MSGQRRQIASKHYVFAPDLIAQAAHILAGHALSSRSMDHGADVTALAGVLLGKTSLNSLYGLLGGLPQTVPQFWLS
jgi:hypothetical protein